MASIPPSKPRKKNNKLIIAQPQLTTTSQPPSNTPAATMTSSSSYSATATMTSSSSSSTTATMTSSSSSSTTTATMTSSSSSTTVAVMTSSSSSTILANMTSSSSSSSATATMTSSSSSSSSTTATMTSSSSSSATATMTSSSSSSTTVATMTSSSSSSTSLANMTSSSSSSAAVAITTMTSSSTSILPSSSTSHANMTSSTSTATAVCVPSSSSTAAVAVASEWGECGWAINAWPRGSIIPSQPGYIFCQLHDDLAHVVPMDDIYAQPPSQLLINRRVNLPEDRTYVLHTRRYLNKNKTTRRSIANTSATWGGRGGSFKTIAGKDETPAGIMYPLVLTFKKKHGVDKKPQHSQWEADEYVSYNCKDGKSAIVVMRCLNAEWRNVETEIDEAQANLEMAYRKYHAFREKVEDSKAQANYWKDAAAAGYPAQLAGAVCNLRKERMKLVMAENELCDFVSSAEEELFDRQPRVTGGIRIQEPSSNVLPRNDMGLVRRVTGEEDNGIQMRYFDLRISRREADRLRAKEKGKNKMMEKRK